MAGSYQLLFDGMPVEDDLMKAIASLQVEENLDLPDAMELEVSVSRTPAGELDFPSDARLRPFANLCVVATPEGGPAECIFDGYVLSHKLHLEPGVTASTLHVWGQDSSWLMNLEEKVREWVDVTDDQAASSIFGDYGIIPSNDNDTEDSPSHPADGHSLMQRGTDIAFLRGLARRTGKVARVACAEAPGVRTGYFCKPNLDGEPVAVISLNDPVKRTVEALDLEWDVTRPTGVKANQALFGDASPEGVSADVASSGLDPLDERDLSTFTGRSMTVRLSAPVDDGGELALRAQALLRGSGWFVRCEGEADVSRVGKVLRVNTVVQLDGLGSVHSGKYLVWSVRHNIGLDAHRMHFVLCRNAMGPVPTPPAGGFP